MSVEVYFISLGYSSYKQLFLHGLACLFFPPKSNKTKAKKLESANVKPCPNALRLNSALDGFSHWIGQRAQQDNPVVGEAYFWPIFQIMDSFFFALEKNYWQLSPDPPTHMQSICKTSESQRFKCRRTKNLAIQIKLLELFIHLTFAVTQAIKRDSVEATNKAITVSLRYKPTVLKPKLHTMYRAICRSSFRNWNNKTANWHYMQSKLH